MLLPIKKFRNAECIKCGVVEWQEHNKTDLDSTECPKCKQINTIRHMSTIRFRMSDNSEVDAVNISDVEFDRLNTYYRSNDMYPEALDMIQNLLDVVNDFIEPEDDGCPTLEMAQYAMQAALSLGKIIEAKYGDGDFVFSNLDETLTKLELFFTEKEVEYEFVHTK